MKIRCDRPSFGEAVSVVSRVVSPRSSIPALEGILIRTGEGGVDLYGYDLDIGICTHVEAVVEEPGEIILPAKVLLDISKRLPGETMSLSAGEKYLTEIKSGAAEYTLPGMSAEEFPEFPVQKETSSFFVPQDALSSMIGQTLFAVSQSDTKPVHTGSLFEVGENYLQIISVDGYRLALRRETLKAGLALRFVVPGKTLAEVQRVLDSSAEEPVGCFVSKKHIFFKTEKYEIYSRLLEGDFLDYKAAIPNNGTIRVRVSTRELTDSVDRVSLLINDRVRSPLRVKFEENEIRLTCSTALGRASDSLAAKNEGGRIEMGFNNRYLLDALRAADCDEVVLEIAGALSPMKVLPVEGDSFLFLVLPVRLKTEG